MAVIPLLYLVFVLSGAAGLVYESIWSRYLGLFVGHSAYAQILVLAIFLGGMSLGALLAGRRSERMRDPLAGYAAVELAVGVIGVLFHGVFVAVTRWSYDALFPAIGDGGALIAAKWAVAGALILPQSVLLGTTFPLMSAGAIRHAAARRRGGPGGTLSMLYFANSLGAAIGVLAAGFWLIRAVGLPGTLNVAAGLNIGVAVVTWLAARVAGAPHPASAADIHPAPAAERPPASRDETEGARIPHPGVAAGIESTPGAAPPASRDSSGIAASAEPPDADRIESTPALSPPVSRDAAAGAPSPHPSGAAGIEVMPAAEPAAGGGIPPARLWRLLLVVSFGTAVASFIYEIAWIRMLSLVLGSATHSFELMLSAFILGLALGALWIRGRADRIGDPVRALALVQLAMGLAALATLPLYVDSFGWMIGLLDALDLTEGGYIAFTLSRYVICLAIMLPATLCAGMTLPLITRTLMTGGMGERAIGAVYGINTLGSIAGVVLAGLVLMPLVGLKSLLVEGAAIDMAIGLLLLRATMRARARDRRLLLAGAAVAAGAIVAANVGVTFDPTILGSGVFRYGRVPAEGSRALVYHQDGRTATVTVVESGGWRNIATNGKPDASLGGTWRDTARAREAAARTPLGPDESTQALLPIISLAHRPDARTAAVIGQGSGMTSHFLLGSPALRQVVTIEIEPAMIEGSRIAFYPANRRVFDDPRSTFVVDDAKSYFASGGRRFDIIVSEPSNPWVSGVSGLFTAEFYAQARRWLADDGVFAQWLHLYEISDDLVLSVLAALHREFPSYVVYQTSKGDILILAGAGATLAAPDWRVFAIPGIARDLAHIIPFSPAQLGALRALDRAALAPLLDGWPVRNSDFHPVLDLGTERTRFLRESASGLGALLESRWDVVAPFHGWRRGFGDALVTPVPHIARAHGLTVGAALRERREAVDSALLARDEELRTALQRRWAIDATLGAATPPRDWRVWLNSTMAAERDLHGGTAGVVDTTFYDAVEGFAARHAAPAGLRRALAFARATAGWDWPRAAALADSLLDDAVAGRGWLPPDDLRENAVVARLRIGDAAGARRVFDALARRSERPVTSLRTRLLEAYIRRAESGERGVE